MLTILKRMKRKPDFQTEIPNWFSCAEPGELPGTKPIFLFQSWIPEHTNKLIASLRDEEDRYGLVDIKMFTNPSDQKTRIEIMKLAEKHGDLYRRMCLYSLLPFQGIAKGLIVTLDWVPAMRHLVLAARTLGIPTILIPHESVFAKENMFYTHSRLAINTPACDVTYCWGALQESIFVSRGYPADRLKKIGAPKFDYLHNLKARKDRRRLTALDLDPEKITITFAAQPLDSQFSQKKAQLAQELALKHAIEWCSLNTGCQILIRMPPARGELFSKELYRLANRPDVKIDDSRIYLLTPEQTIEATDILVSVNSTMLLEAVLGERVAISSKYILFNQIWDNVKIPVAHNKNELFAHLTSAVERPELITRRYTLDWAQEALSCGTFDGRSAKRIKDALSSIAAGDQDIRPLVIPAQR